MRTVLIGMILLVLPCVASADREAIVATALDYAEGWYTGDAERMERCLHPDLAKRVIKTDPESGRSSLEHMGAMKLVQMARAGYGKKVPKSEQLKDVTILDIYGNVASVKVDMVAWIDYLHIAKFNGRWVIVNVLWELKPRE